MRDVQRWMGGEPLPMWSGMDHEVTLRRLRAGEVLVHEGQRLDTLYVVGAGSLKLFVVEGDGFEQVSGFVLRGDVVGLDACITGRHPYGAVALEDTTVALLSSRYVLNDMASQSVEVPVLRQAVLRELRLHADVQHMMAPTNAEVRVARFLIHFARRQGAMGFSQRHFRLPMNRRDMASYLGLAHETISRSLTLLAQADYLRVEQREVEILDPDRFAAMAHATRGASICADFKRGARGRTVRATSSPMNGVEPARRASRSAPHSTNV